MQGQSKLGTGQDFSIQAELQARQDSRSLFKDRMAHVRAQQQELRAQPLGGRLLAVKKVLHWFTASAFDRQAKVIDSLLDLVEDIGIELVQMRQVQRQASLLPDIDRQLPDVDRQQEAEVPDNTAEPTTTATAAAEVCGGWPTKVLEALNTGAEMAPPERLVLYSLVFGIKPRNCLEIGTFQGGSAAIISSAMDDNGHGHLVCVDPHPRIPEQLWEAISHRSTLVQGPSPEVLPEARKAVSENFDFVLIDGDHGYEGVLKDIEGTLGLLVSGARMLFHDCHFYEVKEAIDEALRRHPKQLVDCGLLSITENPVQSEDEAANGRPVIWGGLRLLLYIGS